MKLVQLIATILLAAFLFSCNATKQNAKKDQKAVWRVKANINLLNEVGPDWAKLNPCYTDTIRIGKVITVIDSSAGQATIKDLKDKISEILEGYPDSLKTVIVQQIQKDCKPVIITNTRYDTIPRDKRIEDALSAKIQVKDVQIGNLEGQNAQLKTENSGLKKDGNKTRWWLIGVSVFSVLLTGGLTYLLFKK